jgi:hypothetical protein
VTEQHYLAIWEFQVRAECVPEFEKIYGPDGQWAQLFRRSPLYFGTELVRDLERAGRYLTIDRWISREALRQFKRQFAADYAALDETCERLTESETQVGDFEESTFECLPRDLSTNPRHFEGFRKSRRGGET